MPLWHRHWPTSRPFNYVLGTPHRILILISTLRIPNTFRMIIKLNYNKIWLGSKWLRDCHSHFTWDLSRHHMNIWKSGKNFKLPSRLLMCKLDFCEQTWLRGSHKWEGSFLRNLYPSSMVFILSLYLELWQAIYFNQMT